MMAFATSSTASTGASWNIPSQPAVLPVAPPTPARVSVEFQAFATDMLKLLELRDGWDSYRAPKPSTRSLAGALVVASMVDHLRPELLEHIEFAPFLDGGVALSVESGEKAADITVNNRGSVRVQFGDVDEEVSLVPDPDAAMLKVKRTIDWLVAA